MRWPHRGGLWIALAIVTVGAWGRWGLPRAESWLRGKILFLAAQATHEPAHIDSLKLHPLLLTLRLEGVRLGNPDAPVFSCRRWSFHTALFKPSPLAWGPFSLGHTELEGVVLRPKGGGGLRWPPDGLGALPFSEIHWSRAVLLLPNSPSRSPVTLTSEAGFLTRVRGTLSCGATGAGDLGPWRLEGFLEEFRGGRWAGRVQGRWDRFPLTVLTGRLPPEAGRWEGAVRMEGALAWQDGEAANEKNWKRFFGGPPTWSLRGEFLDARWSPGGDGTSDGVPVTGGWEWAPGKVSAKSLRFWKSLDVSGEMGWPWTPRTEGQVRWKGDRIPLGSLQRSGFSFLRFLPKEGWVATQGEWSGSWSDPRGRMDVDVGDAVVWGCKIPPLKGGGSWGPEGVSLALAGLNGLVSIASEGTASHPPKKQWSVVAKGLDLRLLARLNQWPDIEGNASGRMVLQSDPSVRAEGDWALDGFRWGAHRREGRVSGQWSWGSESLWVAGDEGKFVLRASATAEGWALHRFSYQDPEGIGVSAEGVLGGPGGGVVRASLSGVPLADLPPLAKRFPQVEGTLHAEGEVSGVWTDPQFSGTLAVDSVRWFPGGPAHRGQMEVHGNRTHIRVPHLQWDDRVTLDGAWFPGRGGQVSATFDRAEAGSVFDLWMGSTAPQGVITGQVSLSQRESTAPWEGWGQVDLKEIRWRRFSADQGSLAFFLEKDAWVLRDLQIHQGTGTFRASGRGEGGGNGEWRWQGEGEMSDFSLGGPWTGGWTFRGNTRKGRTEGEIHSSDLSWRRTPLQGFQARVFSDATSWGVAEASCGVGLRGRGAVDRVSGALTGETVFSSSDESDVGALFGFPVAGRNWGLGHWEVRGGWGGLLTAPRLDFSGLLTDGHWGAWPFSAQWSGRWTKERLEVTQGKVHSVHGGEMNFGGGMSFSVGTDTASPTLDYFAEGKDLPLGPWLRSVEPASRWEGSIQGRMDGGGAWGSPWARVSVSAALKNNRTLTTAGRALFQNGVVTVEDLMVKGDEGFLQVRAGSRVTGLFSGGGDFQWGVDARNVLLGPLTFFGGAAVGGRWGHGEGVTARVRGQSLWVNQQFFDRDLAQVHWTPGSLAFQPLSGGAPYITGEVDLTPWPQVRFNDLSLWDGPLRKLVLSGEAGPKRWAFDLTAAGMEAETLVALANLDWPVTGVWEARVRGEGSPSAPNLWATVRGKNGKIAAVPYDRLETDLEWKGPTAVLRNVKVSRAEGYLLTGEVRFPVAGSQTPWDNGHAHLVLSDGNLKVLEDLWPVCRRARGAFSAELDIDAGPEGPRSAGYFRIANGSMQNRTYARQVRDLALEMVLVDDLLKIQTGEARVGKGRMGLSGTVALHRLSPVEYNVRLLTREGPGVEIEIPQLSVPPGPLLSRFSLFQESLKGSSRGAVRFSLDLTGPPGEHVVSGRVVMDDTQFTYPPLPGAMDRLRGPRWWREFWRDARWDVVLQTGKGTWFRNEYVNVEINGGLRLMGRPKAWTANGKIEASQGVINYLGQNFTVTRGAFEVLTDTRPGVGGGVFPYVSGEAMKEVAGVDSRGFANDDVVTMVIDRARLGEIQPRFLSRNSPSLASDRVAIRALGLSGETQLSQEERDQLFRAGLVQLVGTSAAPFANRLAQNFGIYMINTIYEPPETSETTPSSTPSPTPSPSPARDLASYLRGAGATARIRLSDRLFGVYKVTLDEAQNQVYFHDEVELVYRVARSLHLRASTELDSEKLLGQPPNRRISLENQWRFGFPRRKKTEE